jgi:hypothetical protein
MQVLILKESCEVKLVPLSHDSAKAPNNMLMNNHNSSNNSGNNNPSLALEAHFHVEDRQLPRIQGDS